MTAEAVSAEPSRCHWIGAPEFFLLNLSCRILHEAYPESLGVYLVGSALRRRDHRDVDIRMMLEDADFDRLFPGMGQNGWVHARWSLLVSSISLWLSEASGGLKIDFQFQRMTDANRDYPKPDHRRIPVGWFLAQPAPAKDETDG